MLKYLLRGLLLYVAIVVGWFAFQYFSATSSTVARLYFSVFPAKTVYWLDGTFGTRETLNAESPLHESKYVADKSPADFTEADLIAILLRPNLSDDELTDLASTGLFTLSQFQDAAKNGAVTRSSKIAIAFRAHPLPFVVTNQTTALVNLSWFEQKYEVDCIGEFVDALILGSDLPDPQEGCHDKVQV